MPISIIVRLRHGRYDAGGDRPSEAEWPPHPARVFCALAAAADGDLAWQALRWLEAQPAPEIWADPAGRVRTGTAAAWVVKNATDPTGGGNLTWPGRDNGLRTRAFAVPGSAAFVVVWPQADPSAAVLAQLRDLARLVPYVGRSTSLAEVSVADSVPEDLDGRVVYEISAARRSAGGLPGPGSLPRILTGAASCISRWPPFLGGRAYSAVRGQAVPGRSGRRRQPSGRGAWRARLRICWCGRWPGRSRGLTVTRPWRWHQRYAMRSCPGFLIPFRPR